MSNPSNKKPSASGWVKLLRDVPAAVLSSQVQVQSTTAAQRNDLDDESELPWKTIDDELIDDTVERLSDYANSSTNSSSNSLNNSNTNISLNNSNTNISLNNTRTNTRQNATISNGYSRSNVLARVFTSSSETNSNSNITSTSASSSSTTSNSNSSSNSSTTSGSSSSSSSGTSTSNSSSSSSTSSRKSMMLLQRQQQYAMIPLQEEPDEQGEQEQIDDLDEQTTVSLTVSDAVRPRRASAKFRRSSSSSQQQQQQKHVVGRSTPSTSSAAVAAATLLDAGTIWSTMDSVMDGEAAESSTRKRGWRPEIRIENEVGLGDCHPYYSFTRLRASLLLSWLLLVRHVRLFDYRDAHATNHPPAPSPTILSSPTPSVTPSFRGEGVPPSPSDLPMPSFSVHPTTAGNQPSPLDGPMPATTGNHTVYPFPPIPKLSTAPTSEPPGSSYGVATEHPRELLPWRWDGPGARRRRLDSESPSSITDSPTNYPSFHVPNITSQAPVNENAPPWYSELIDELHPSIEPSAVSNAPTVEDLPPWYLDIVNNQLPSSEPSTAATLPLRTASPSLRPSHTSTPSSQDQQDIQDTEVPTVTSGQIPTASHRKNQRL
ncbi:hypothetical protein MHU86_21966 [Fragilaria crotonensis]|nr:hypothetical protein MHU86_21966 [Fragilaria crotonensis]